MADLPVTGAGAARAAAGAPGAPAGASALVEELRGRFGDALRPQATRDDIPTFWVPRDRAREVLRHLKTEARPRFEMLYDLAAIDERLRAHREGQPPSDFTVVYHLQSYSGNAWLRLKVALEGEFPSLPSISDLWPNASWYEREAWDMFGVVFDGHPRLERLLMPPTWVGHPLRKEEPARATEREPFRLPQEKEDREQAALRFSPEARGMAEGRDGADFIFLNVGPQHPGTHGILRVVVQLDGEEIVDAIPEIGFHHRGAEKMAERQTWHTYIPYTDRIDYLAGVNNNLAYLASVELLAGIEPPPRAQVARVMLCELFRIISHLVWYGTFAQDLGQMSPVFYTFNDRERAFGIVEAITGARMHPSWFRIGGLAADLPRGWDGLLRDFLRHLPPRLAEYDREVMHNGILRARTVGVGELSVADALDWGTTGPNLRASGLAWDLRKKQPYSGYEQFEFDVPVGRRGDCYDRAAVRVEEMRQSLRILQQCLDHMPVGPYQAMQDPAAPPLKERTMRDIETLITHFLGVSWGPVLPPGEAMRPVEVTKGSNGYYLVSDGSVTSYRTRIRTPSFAALQMLPILVRGGTIPDLLAVLGSLDYVLADIDR